MPRYLLHLPIALILSTLAEFTAAQQDEVSIPSSLLVSASSGDAEAQYLLGQSLDQGQLFGAEIREAFNWYKQSADQGYALAETVVGLMYVEGRGVPQNFSEGEDYLLRAASKGLSAAQLVLGGIKLESEEFPQAYLLFSLAMTLAEDEETYNEATAGRGEAETNLQEAEITVLQSRATSCIESEFERCDFGPLSLEDLSFLDVVEPEVEVEAEEAEEISSPQIAEQRQERNEAQEEAQVLIPSNCTPLDGDSFQSVARINGEEYPLVFTYSNIPAVISSSLAQKLGLRVRKDALAEIITATERRQREFVRNLDIEIFGNATALGQATVSESEDEEIALSLLLFSDYVVQLDFPGEKLCLFDKSSVDLAELQNIDLDISGQYGTPVVQVEFANGVKPWLRLVPSSKELLVDTALARFLSLSDTDSRVVNDEFMAATVDYMKLGPFEMGGIEAVYPKQGVSTNISERQQTLTMTHIQESRDSLGYLGFDLMRHFIWYLDPESKRGFITIPDTSQTESNQVVEQTETATDMSAMSLSDDLRPASFEGGDSDFISRIEFPDVDGDVDLEVLCEAGITRSGRFDWNNCFPDDYDVEEEFIDSVHSASRRGRINPAHLNGRTRSAFVTYRVSFIKNAQDTNITIFPNDGSESKTLGDKYFSAQWLPRVLRTSWSNCFTPKNDELPTFGLQIDSAGTLSDDVEFSENLASDRIERCQQAVARMMRDQEFIPSFIGAKFIESMWQGRMYRQGINRDVVDEGMRNSPSGILAYCTGTYLDRRPDTARPVAVRSNGRC